MTHIMRWTGRELLISAAAAVGLFIVLGTLAALWRNPLFVRMTPTSGFEIALLAVQAVLGGLYLGLKGRACAPRAAGAGGALGFLGIACPVCNKLLLLAFGSALLLEYVEPIRLYAGPAGTALLVYALRAKLSRPACTAPQTPPRAAMLSLSVSASSTSSAPPR